PPPADYMGEAVVAANTRVFAERGVGPWAMLTTEQRLNVRYVAGEEWVALSTLPGVSGKQIGCYREAIGQEKRDPLEHAWVPLAAVQIPGLAELQANARKTALQAPTSAKLAQAREAAGISGLGTVSVGDDFACAIGTGGSVYCWGNNVLGQLGDGTFESRNTPAPVVGLTDVTQLSSGLEYTCALRRTGHVACWGHNIPWSKGPSSGQSSPTLIDGLTEVVSIAAGASFTCALGQSGKVQCWGNNDQGQLGDGSNKNRASVGDFLDISSAIHVTAGMQHACALLHDGTIKCWGDNRDCQLGMKHSPQWPVAIPGLSNIRYVEAGSKTCAIQDDGQMFCWGGRRDCEPDLVEGLNDAIHVAIGRSMMCHTGATGQTKCRGWYGRRSLLATTGLVDPVDVDVGDGMACARQQDGAVQCWGEFTQYDAHLVNGIDSATDVTIGKGQACAVLRDGGLFCWGDRPLSSTGSRMRLADDESVQQADTEGIDTCYVDSNSTLHCRGGPGLKWGSKGGSRGKLCWMRPL
ncbi:MAG: hypothetical protein HN348_24975, partial [Proteobacteria bacterium]|nr:hypothetical protein [Pseudomonadota bacterium]